MLVFRAGIGVGTILQSKYWLPGRCGSAACRHFGEFSSERFEFLFELSPEDLAESDVNPDHGRHEVQANLDVEASTVPNRDTEDEEEERNTPVNTVVEQVDCR